MFIVGVGPGSPKYLTEKAREAIQSSDIVMGWKLDLLPIESLLNGKEIYVQNASNYREVAKSVAAIAEREAKNVAVARIGDPCISSGLSFLLETFSGFQVEIIPGISSVQVAASKAKINIDDSVIVSFHDYGDHDIEKKFMIDAFKAGKHLIVLTGPDLTPRDVARTLIQGGCKASEIAIVYSNLTFDDEKVFTGTLEDISEKEFNWLSLMTVLNPSVPSAEDKYRLWISWRERSNRRRRRRNE